jgi:hypothetical protein
VKRVTFDSIGQADTNAVVGLLPPRAPRAVTVKGEPVPPDAFDYKDGVLRLRFQNRAETMRVSVAR